MMHRMLGLVTAAALLVSAGCYAQPTATLPANWKTECVGRYQVSVPGEVEIILPTPEDLADSSSNPMTYRYLSKSQMSSLLRNREAPYSHFSALGSFGITPPVPQIDFDNLKSKIKAEREDTKKSLLEEAAEYEKDGHDSLAKNNRDAAARIKPMDYDTPAMFGGGADTFATLYLYQNNRIFIYDFEHGDHAAELSFLKDFRSRAPYELPKQPGICIPYGFIADDGKADRSISVTMRLKNHPDVEVFFRDNSGDLSSGSNEPKDNIEYFWTMMYRDFAKLLEADSRKYYTVKMGEQEGTAMFVTITRHDGSKDYGYIAIVKGDPTTDTRSQMLYVIRTAKRAKGKPVSKDELKDIAEQITASVKRHAVQ